MEEPEIQQIRALKEGNETAFEMIFRSYYQALCNYAFTFVRDKDEAEEIVQSSFVTVWDKRSSLDIQTSLKAYLYSMVRNASLNKIKHEKVKQRHIAEQQVILPQASDAVSDTVLSSELETKIWTAMEHLPEQCRLIFKMSRFEEMKYAEIADQLNISVKTVENQIGKALRIMREQLRDYLPVLLIILSGLFK